MQDVPNFAGFKFTDKNFYKFQQLMAVGEVPRHPSPRPPAHDEGNMHACSLTHLPVAFLQDCVTLALTLLQRCYGHACWHQCGDGIRFNPSPLGLDYLDSLSELTV